MRGLLMLMLVIWSCWGLADTLVWGKLRDGDLYLNTEREATLTLRWQPAWQADANHEQLYLLDGHGRLMHQIDVDASQTRGVRQFALGPGDGDHRLSVPGYSFRAWEVELPGYVQALYEPVKLHFNSEVGPGVQLYFRVAARQQASLAGKYHGGVNLLVATRLSDGRQVRLPLREHEQYWAFDNLPLPDSERDEIWRLDLGGQGKAAFWLDGTDNLFAMKVQHLRQVQLPPGQVELTLGAARVGRTPELGVALPYTDPPEAVHPLLRELGLRAATYYSFVDVLPEQPGREIGYRRLYAEEFGLRTSVTLLAGTGRRAVLAADPQTLAGLAAWLADSALLGQGPHYLGFADEPNLNYPDFPSFARYFGRMLEALQGDPRAAQAGIRVVAPASSRWLDGPFRPGAARRRGVDWTQQLLAQYSDRIDALAWHEWMVRDLLATRRYRQSVAAAARLVGLDEHGRPRKALLLDQTNISSGAALSPYEQDSHFAALWWASVVINSSQDGLLELLSWFQAADEPDYPKGMLRMDESGSFQLKPVAQAQALIARHWLPQVQELANDAFEVDALALAGGQRRAVLGVNKVGREQQVRLIGLPDDCRGLRLEGLGPEGPLASHAIDCTEGQGRFRVPGNTLFILYWEV